MKKQLKAWTRSYYSMKRLKPSPEKNETPEGLTPLEKRLLEKLAERDEDIAELKKQVNILSQVVRAEYQAGRFHESVTQHLITEFGFDTPERLRPRR